MPLSEPDALGADPLEVPPHRPCGNSQSRSSRRSRAPWRPADANYAVQQVQTAPDSLAGRDKTMMWGFGLTGALLVSVALWDAIAHTIVLRGGGPIARRLGESIWRLVILTRHWRWFPRLAPMAGPFILLSAFLVWSLLLWIGWTLIFLADPQGIVKGATSAAASAWDRLYYSGFVLTTLGIGDYEPRSALFQILTVISAGMGFFSITLFVTYLLSVLNAVVFKRSLAFDILSLARTPEQLVIRAWQDGRFRSLEQYMLATSSDLVALSQKHLAYPTLHYFHTTDPKGSPGVAVTVLDEALTLLSYGVAEGHRPDRLLMRSVRESSLQLADTVTYGRGCAGERAAPPAPSLAALREAGVPTVSDGDFARDIETLAVRRAKFAALVHYEGRDWAVVGGDDAQAAANR